MSLADIESLLNIDCLQDIDLSLRGVAFKEQKRRVFEALSLAIQQQQRHVIELLLTYTLKSYPHEHLQTIDDHICAYITLKPPRLDIQGVLSYYPKDKLNALIKKLFFLLRKDAEASKRLCEYVIKTKSAKLSVSIIKSQVPISKSAMIELTQLLPLTELSHLLYSLKKSQATDTAHASIYNEKCISILSQILSRYHKETEDVIDMLKGPMGRRIALFGLSAYQSSHPDAFPFLVNVLEQVNLDSHDKELIAAINRGLMAILKEGNKDKAIKILTLYQQKISIANLYRWIEETNQTSHGDCRLFLPLIDALETADKHNLLTKIPNLYPPLTIQILKHFSLDELAIQLLLTNSHLEGDTQYLKNALYQHITNGLKQSGVQGLELILPRMSVMLTPLFIDFVNNILLLLDNSGDKCRFVFYLLANIHQIQQHQLKIKQVIENALCQLLNDENLPQQDILNLLAQYRIHFGDKAIIKLTDEASRRQKPHHQEALALIIRQDESLYQQLIYSGVHCQGLLISMISQLDNDALVKLIQKSLQQSVSRRGHNFTYLLEELSHRLKVEDDTDTALYHLMPNLYLAPSFFEALLSSPICFINLSTLYYDFFGSGLLYPTSSSAYSALKNRLFAVIKAAPVNIKSPRRGGRFIRTIAQNLLIERHTNPSQLIDMLRTLTWADSASTDSIMPFLKELKHAIYVLLKPSHRERDSVSDTILYQAIDSLGATPLGLNQVCSSMVKDALISQRPFFAARQLERISASLTHSQIELDIEPEYIAELLLHSELDSTNWHHCEKLAKSIETAEVRISVIQKFNELVLTSATPLALKQKCAAFIANHILTAEALQKDPVGLLSKTLSYLPQHFKKDNVSSLFFYDICNMLHQSNKLSAKSLASLMSAYLLNHADEDELNIILSHPKIHTPSMLASLWHHFELNEQAPKNFARTITALVLTKDKLFKKAFLKTLFDSPQNKPQHGHLIKDILLSIPNLKHFNKDEEAMVMAYINQNCEQILKHYQSVSSNFGQVNKDQEVLLIKQVQLFSTSLNHLLKLDSSFSASLLNIPPLAKVLKRLIKDDADGILMKQFTGLMKDLPVHFLISLHTKLKGSKLLATFYQSIETALSQREYAQTLDKDDYALLFDCLPALVKTRLAKKLLLREPYADWQLKNIHLFTREVNARWLYQQLKTISAKALFAKLIFLQADTSSLPDKAIVKAIKYLESSERLEDLLSSIPATLNQQVSEAIIKHLCLPNIESWLEKVSLFPNTFLLLLNGIISTEYKTLFSELFNIKDGLYENPWQKLLEKALFDFKGEFSIQRQSLLYDMTQSFIQTPVKLSKISAENLCHITHSIDITDMTSALEDNERALDRAEYLSTLFHPFLTLAETLSDRDCPIANYVVVARWYETLPLVNATVLKGHFYLNKLSYIDAESFSPVMTKPLETIRQDLDDFAPLMSPFFDTEGQNIIYQLCQKHIQILSHLISILKKREPLPFKEIRLLQRYLKQLSHAKDNYDELLASLTKSHLNTCQMVMSPQSKLAIPQFSKTNAYVRRFPLHHQAYWHGEMIKSATEAQQTYTLQLKAVHNMVKARLQDSFQTPLNTSQVDFIKSILHSKHLGQSTTLIKQCCEMLTPHDVRTVIEQSHDMLDIYKKTNDLLTELNQRLTASPLATFIDALYSESTSTLRNLLCLCQLNKAHRLHHLINVILNAKTNQLPQSSLKEIILPQSISHLSESLWLKKELNAVIQQESHLKQLLQSIFEYGLGYQTNQPIEKALDHLASLSNIEHQAMYSDSIAKVINSFASPIYQGDIDVFELNKSLSHVLNQSDFSKQSHIIAHIDTILMNYMIKDCVLGLSSPSAERANVSSHLLEMLCASALRDGANPNHAEILKNYLDQTHFSKYQQKLLPFIHQLAQSKPTLSSQTIATTSQRQQETMNGIWCQRIIVNPQIVSELTVEEFSDLIRRYRLISKFLKSDQYREWEAYAHKQIQVLKLHIRNKQRRLDNESSLRETEKSQLQHDIRQLLKDIERIEDKKRRLLKFKSFDAIRELLCQLEENIALIEDRSVKLAAQATYSQYLQLELCQYKKDIFSRSLNALHHKLSGTKGDLEQEQSLLIRLANQYLPHDNDIIKEQLRKHTLCPTGSILYDQGGTPVARLDEMRKVIAIDSLTQGEEIDSLVDAHRGHEGMALYNHQQTLVGFLNKDSELQADNVFMAKTSSEILCYTPLAELMSLNGSLALLLQDVINEGALPYLYDELTSSFSLLKDHKQHFATSKARWVMNKVHHVLLQHADSLTLSNNTMSSIVAHHLDSQIIELLDKYSLDAPEEAKRLLRALLNTPKRIALLFKNDKVKIQFFKSLSRLNLTKEDVLSWQANIADGATTPLIMQYLNGYLLTKDLDRPQEQRILNQLNLSFFPKEIIALWPKRIKSTMALSPKHRLQLNHDKMTVLIGQLNEDEKLNLYIDFMTHSAKRLFFDKGLCLYFTHNPDLFWQALNRLSSSSLKEDILIKLLTSPLTIDAVYQSLAPKAKEFNLVQQTKRLYQFMAQKETPFQQALSPQIIWHVINHFVNGFHTTAKMAFIIETMLQTKLQHLMNASQAPSKQDIRALLILAESKEYKDLKYKKSLTTDIYDSLLSLCAKKGVNTLFYDEQGRFITSRAAKKVKRTLLLELCDRLSPRKRALIDFNQLSELTWADISDTPCRKLNRIPWTDTLGRQKIWQWQDIAHLPLKKLDSISENVTAIDLFLLDYQGPHTELNLLLKHYLSTFYRQNTTIPLPPGALKPLISTAALLLNDEVNKAVKEAIFKNFVDNPRLLYPPIFTIMAKYNLKQCLSYYGQRKNYDQLIALSRLSRHMDNQLDRNKLSQAREEAEAEKKLSQMKGWFSVIRLWWYRITHYGWHGLFVPNKPTYVAPFDAKLRDITAPPQPLNSTVLINVSMPQARQKARLLIKQSQSILKQLLAKPHTLSLEDCQELVHSFTAFKCHHQVSVALELELRQSFNTLFHQMHNAYNVLIKNNQDAKQLFITASQLALLNRARLAELYHYDAKPHAKELATLKAQCQYYGEHALSQSCQQGHRDIVADAFDSTCRNSVMDIQAELVHHPSRITIAS